MKITKKTNGDIVIETDTEHKSRRTYGTDDIFEPVYEACDNVDDYLDELHPVAGFLGRAVTLPTRGIFGEWI